MTQARRGSDDRLERLQAFADTVAAFRHDGEIADGISADRAVAVLGAIIHDARLLSEARPAWIDCWRCDTSGIIATGVSPKYTCPTCNGEGRIKPR